MMKSLKFLFLAYFTILLFPDIASAQQNLNSNFFRNDITAQSVLSGNSISLSKELDMEVLQQILLHGNSSMVLDR